MSEEKIIIDAYLYTSDLPKGIMALTVDQTDVERIDELKEFYRAVLGRERDKGEPVKLEVEVKLWRKHRTVGQLRLFHAIINRMVDVTDMTHGIIYAGIIDTYYPCYDELWKGKLIKKTTNDLNTVEMAKVIENTIVEALECRADIKDIWCLWQDWRGRYKHGDPLEGTYTGIDDYRIKHPVCEACGIWLDDGAGEMAHIVPRGNAGSDEDWNLLHLCNKHHIFCVHQSGLSQLREKAKHLKWKIDKSLDRHGRTLNDVKDFIISKKEKGEALDVPNETFVIAPEPEVINEDPRDDQWAKGAESETAELEIY